jgi:medium-chain acyl-[acyl-carrier-protein] hydrolase
VSNLFRETHRVRFFDAEPGGRAGIPAICRLMEEAANSQTAELGLSISQVREAGRMWVLTRFALTVFALPKMGDQVTVETWASDRTAGVRAYRDFRMFDADGHVLAEAATLWLLLDLGTRRLVRLPDSVLQIRHPGRVGAQAVDSVLLVAPATSGVPEEFKIRWSDLDENNHANNLRYIEWVMDAVPFETRRDAVPVSLDIQFQNEGRLGETVLSATEASGDVFLHSLTAGDGRVLGVARTVWRRD